MPYGDGGGSLWASGGWLGGLGSTRYVTKRKGEGGGKKKEFPGKNQLGGRGRLTFSSGMGIGSRSVPHLWVAINLGVIIPFGGKRARFPTKMDNQAFCERGQRKRRH